MWSSIVRIVKPEEYKLQYGSIVILKMCGLLSVVFIVGLTYLLLSLVAVLSLMMSNQSEAPKESSCQDWSASAASTLAADQSEHSTSRAGDSQEQPSGGVQSLAVVPNPSPAPASTPVALATASLPQQPMSHLQLVSQMVSGATTQSAQVRWKKIAKGFICCCVTFECILDIKCCYLWV